MNNNKKNLSVYSPLGASNHSLTEREEHDYYASPPFVISCLLNECELPNHKIWEPACGEGHLSKPLIKAGFDVYSTDLYNRGFGNDFFDFLHCDIPWGGDILTNPPYKYAQEFVEHSLELINNGNKVYMLLKLSFLEGKKRRELFNQKMLEKVYVFSNRITCGKNGIFPEDRGAVAYAWFMFRKGADTYPEIRWIN